jgi:hypothetical protein
MSSTSRSNGTRFIIIVAVFSLVGPIVGGLFLGSALAINEALTSPIFLQTLWPLFVVAVQQLHILLMVTFLMGGVLGALVGLIVAAMARRWRWSWGPLVLPAIATVLVHFLVLLALTVFQPRFVLIHPLLYVHMTIQMFPISLVAALVCGFLVRHQLRPA